MMQSQPDTTMKPTISKNITLSALNDNIMCRVCGGYLIEATTTYECLHTFCKSCLLKHLKQNNTCPQCNSVIHENRPLDYISHDRTMQDIVYKLVPNLYLSELKRQLNHRRKKNKSQFTLTDKDLRNLLQKNYIHVTLKPLEKTNNIEPIYLACPFGTKIQTLRKLLIFKYQLGTNVNIEFFYKGDSLSDMDSVSNIAQAVIFCINYKFDK